MKDRTMKHLVDNLQHQIKKARVELRSAKSASDITLAKLHIQRALDYLYGKEPDDE